MNELSTPTQLAAGIEVSRNGKKNPRGRLGRVSRLKGLEWRSRVARQAMSIPAATLSTNRR